ncbi:MAG: phosphoribosylformylglycinamidine synthase subunit PurQ [Candidatus Omnitrophica bacterium]|nr:phosphoribosylformylglycinamidine synthase subunit PurQ [Candidatus Omnitrophota bacterium]
MNAVVVVFPGSNCDADCFHALSEVMGSRVKFVWHKERDLPKTDVVVLPGGFSYGDYLRTGAIARFSPIMSEVRRHAEKDRPVVGICNGFQILLEAGLLPGAMLRNRSLKFSCKFVHIQVANNQTMFTKAYRKHQILKMPIAHGEGNYFCDHDTLKELREKGRIAFRYVTENGEATDRANPNGSMDNIAGIFNERKNILGMMPHPERASEGVLSSTDGQGIWESLAECVGV